MKIVKVENSLFTGKIENFVIKINTSIIWNKYKINNGFVYYTGSVALVEKLKEQFLNKNFSEKKIKKFLLDHNRNSSLIIKTNNFFLIVTSFSRDNQIFFRLKKKKIIVSNNIKNLEINNDELDEKSLFEFSLSGYSLGMKTLVSGVYSLGPASIIYGTKEKFKILRYFCYHKTLKKKYEKNIKEYFFKINEIIDDSINHIIENSNDRTIFIPLSGGLDSRLIISKFHEKKYKNIKSFSYGLKNNADALIAKKVADHLDIKWDYIWFEKDKFRKLYFSNFKKEYDNIAYQFSCIPSYGEVFFLNFLKEKKYFTKNPIMVNGQSGDFNTGLHIPKSLYDLDKNNLSNKLVNVVEAINKKHFCLWLRDELKINNYEINETIENSLDKDLLNYPLSDIYENWEYSERQCKYVVNGQKAYEFFNFDWFLPLWDSEFVKFWTTVPLELRYKQNLYRAYLYDWNYKDIFEGINDKVTAFTGAGNLGIRIFSFFLNFILTKDSKQKILGFTDYFSRYGSQYQFFSFYKFLQMRGKVKNAVGFHIRQLLDEKELLNDVYSG